MLVLGSTISGTPIMSLQTGRRLASAGDPIIDPRNLTIVAYYCKDHVFRNKIYILRTADIRDYGSMGFIIDSVDELVEPEDIINIQKVIDIKFNIIGLNVEDEDKVKLGKVENYSVESKTFLIEQIKVRRPLLKSFNDTGLLISRNQIVEVTDEKIVVRSTKVKAEEKIKYAPQAFINPFATSNPQSELDSSS